MRHSDRLVLVLILTVHQGLVERHGTNLLLSYQVLHIPVYRTSIMLLPTSQKHCETKREHFYQRGLKEISFITDAFEKKIIKPLLKLHIYIAGVSLEKQKATSTFLICYKHPKDIKSITRLVL